MLHERRALVILGGFCAAALLWYGVRQWGADRTAFEPSAAGPFDARRSAGAIRDRSPSRARDSALPPERRGALPRLDRAEGPALAGVERRLRETDTHYRVRMLERADYLRFVDEAPGLTAEQEVAVRRILADAQHNNTLGYKAERAALKDRVPPAEIHDAEWVRTFNQEYRQRLRDVLTPGQFRTYELTIGGYMSFIAAEPFDLESTVEP